MRFAVRRTSNWGDTPPCEEAKIENYIRVDTRHVDAPEKIPIYRNNKEWANKDWFGKGTNHRVEDGKIKRNFNEKGYFIRLNTLKDLDSFVEKYGDVVISKSDLIDGVLSIEIYDTYRE